MPLRIRRGPLEHRHLESTELRHRRELTNCLGGFKQILGVRVAFRRFRPDCLEEEGIPLEVLRGAGYEPAEVQAAGFWESDAFLQYDDTNELRRKE